MGKQNQDILNNTTIDSTSTTLALSNRQGIGERRRISVRGVLCTLFCLGAAMALSNWLVAGTPAPVAAQATTLEEECSNGIAVPDPQDNPGLVADCVTLLSIRDTLAGTALLDWSTQTPVLYWQGVSVSNWDDVTTFDSRVYRLYLPGHQLTGSIPPALGNLSQLVYLNLSNNQLTGSIPPALGNLSELEHLYLADNQLTGSIPPELSNLSELTYLHLSNNQLTGSIPPELGNLSDLQNLYLWDNQLTGSIPPALGNLSELQALGLSGNQFSGCIPNVLISVWISDLSRLGLPLCDQDIACVEDCATLLGIKDTLAGTASLNWSTRLPVSLWEGIIISNSRVTELYLYGDQLTGRIPPELGNLSQLTLLDLHSNELTGNIPATLGNLSELQALGLSGNQLTGNIPPALGNLPKLEWLSMSYNQLTGIPPELGNLPKLKMLDLESNQLTGNIPPALGSLPKLTELYLRNNELTGPIPPELGSIPNLRSLSLGSNQLTGSIPPELGNLSKLDSLSLFDNRLTGSIPPELGNLSKLEALLLSGNQLRGCIPYALTTGWLYSDLSYLGLPVCAQETPVPMPTIVSPVATALAISPGTTQSISPIAIPSNQGHQTFLPLVQH